MSNSHQIDLISNKIILLNDYSIEFIESNIKKLTPAGKYQAYLLTTAIIFNRLKAIDAFNTNSINTDSLTVSVIENAEKKFYEYKIIHDKIYNTFIHYSSIIQGAMNRENRNFFKNDLPELRKKSILTIMEFNNELNRQLSFSNIYINLFIYPFFNTNVPAEELNSLRRTYLDITNEINHFELDDFKQNISQLINNLTNKLNEDSYFISNMSGKVAGNKNCYIATLVYKDIDHPKVELLRNFRDNNLNKYYFGKLFIKLYYKFSPKLVKILTNHNYPQVIIKYILDILLIRLVKNSQLKNLK
jgi:hypothetical protein